MKFGLNTHIVMQHDSGIPNNTKALSSQCQVFFLTGFDPQLCLSYERFCNVQ